MKNVFTLRLGFLVGFTLLAVSGFANDDALKKELIERKVNLSDYWGRRVERELSVPNRVEYVMCGKVPLAAELLDFLFEHLPLTAKLVNAYQNTAYQISYLDEDKRRFLARIKGLRGRMNLLSPWQQTDKRVYYGDGEGNFLWWHLYGTVLVFVDVKPLQKQSCEYELRIYLFNESSFVNDLLSLGVVQWVIKGRITNILEHIVQSAVEFREDGGLILQGNSEFKSAKERKFLADFLLLDSLSLSD